METLVVPSSPQPPGSPTVQRPVQRPVQSPVQSTAQPPAQPPPVQREPSAIYKLVMTPLIFVTFLVSLALVDLRHTQLRSRSHAGAVGHDPGARPAGPFSFLQVRAAALLSWLQFPHWLPLHLYHYQPYQYVRLDQNGQPIGGEVTETTGDPRWYYHRKQHRLIKIHIHDALENIQCALQIRRSVLAGMALLSLVVLWIAWKGLAWLMRKGGVMI